MLEATAAVVAGVVVITPESVRVKAKSEGNLNVTFVRLSAGLSAAPATAEKRASLLARFTPLSVTAFFEEVTLILKASAESLTLPPKPKGKSEGFVELVVQVMSPADSKINEPILLETVLEADAGSTWNAESVIVIAGAVTLKIASNPVILLTKATLSSTRDVLVVTGNSAKVLSGL